MYSSDFLVIGSGLASLVFALRAADEGPVTIVTKRQPFDGNTGYAQGGIAAPLGGDADFESHVQDTLSAGAGLCDEAAVRSILAAGPAAVARLDAATRTWTVVDGTVTEGRITPEELGLPTRRADELLR